MPPQTPKSIATYFNKLPSSAPKSPTSPRSAARVTSTATTKVAGDTSTSATRNGVQETVTTIDAAIQAGPSSSPLTVLDSSPSAPVTAEGSSSKKRFLSDAARQAIRDAVSEDSAAEGSTGSGASPAPKRVKMANGRAAPVADIFKKPLSSPAKPLSLPLARSREELRRNLEGKAKASLLDMELDTLGEDWLLALQEELTKPYFQTLKEFVTREQASKKVFPPAADVYSWSQLCPLQDVRVVIVGQDPYHDDGQAHGLAFSVRKGMRIPPSLRNIYKEMGDEIPGFTIPKHGDLTEWAKHGVLLLNTSLTVRAHEAASHSNKGWETFTAAVLRVVTSRLSPSGGGNGVCFMAWGAHAQKMCAGVDTKKHLVLKSVHPSPLAAARGFFGNGHFKKANVWLEERYGPGGGIDWAALGASP